MKDNPPAWPPEYSEYGGWPSRFWGWIRRYRIEETIANILGLMWWLLVAITVILLF